MKQGLQEINLAGNRVITNKTELKILSLFILPCKTRSKGGAYIFPSSQHPPSLKSFRRHQKLYPIQLTRSRYQTMSVYVSVHHNPIMLAKKISISGRKVQTNGAKTLCRHFCFSHLPIVSINKRRVRSSPRTIVPKTPQNQSLYAWSAKCRAHDSFKVICSFHGVLFENIDFCQPKRNPDFAEHFQTIL